MFDEICSMKNLLLAAKKATKGKKSRHGAARFWFHREAELLKIQRELQDETYAFGPYREFEICDKGIKRKISAAPFRDRVVHHAMMNLLEPIFEKSFIHDTYANRKGKGVFAALKRAHYFARRYTHVLKLDIRKYFPSIDHAILKSMIAKKYPAKKRFGLSTALLTHPIFKRGSSIILRVMICLHQARDVSDYRWVISPVSISATSIWGCWITTPKRC